MNHSNAQPSHRADGPSPEAMPCTNAEIQWRMAQIAIDMTYKQVAIATGFNAESVRRYLGGHSKIPADFVAAFAAAFEVDPAQLLLRKVDDRPIDLPNPVQGGELADEALEALRPRLRAWFVSILPASQDDPSPGASPPLRGRIEPKQDPELSRAHLLPDKGNHRNSNERCV
jgi:transcriptional regulator with XRE-family HTH domain